MSPTYFEIVTFFHKRLPNTFLAHILLQLDVLEKEYMEFDLGRIVNWANFEFVVGTQVWLPYSFSNWIFLRLVEQEKEDMDPNRGMQIVDKVVENLTQGRWILMNFVKSGNYFEIIAIGLGTWIILSRIIPTRHIWLVHVVHSRVGVIRVKWGQGEIWIHIRIEKIIVVKIYFKI